MNPNLDIACTGLAEQILFGGISRDSLSYALHKHSVQFRKGKTFEHLQDAVKKGLKAGNQKTEFEISMVACYLAKVVKLT